MSRKKQVYGEVEERYLPGLIGAFIFSLVGGAVWYLLYQFGYLAGLSGVIGVLCAVKGYKVFGKKESVKGVVSAVIISTVVIVLAWYLCIVTDIAKAYEGWYESGENYYTLTPIEYIQSAWTFLTKLEFIDGASVYDAESTRVGYFGDLAIGLVLCIVCSFSAVKLAIKNAKNSGAVETASTEVPQAVEAVLYGTTEPQNVETPVETAAEQEAPTTAQETVKVELPEMPELPTIDDIPVASEETVKENNTVEE